MGGQDMTTHAMKWRWLVWNVSDVIQYTADG